MNKKISILAIVLFVIAAVIVCAGIYQVDSAVKYTEYSVDSYITYYSVVEEADITQVTDDFWMQSLPEIVNNAIIYFGFAALVFAAGLIFGRLDIYFSGKTAVCVSCPPEERNISREIVENADDDDDDKKTKEADEFYEK